MYAVIMLTFPQKNVQLCICCTFCMRVSSGAGRLSF